MSRKVVNKGGHGVGTPYDFPAYEYDPVNDSFKDLETGKTFTKNGNAKLEANKAVTVSANGPQIITPSPTYDGMEKVTLDVQVPASADLEANHTETIDVSQYTDPVEITPASGKDGMEKCTVILSNIPSGGATAYAWVNDIVGTLYTDFSVAPSNKAELLQKKQIGALLSQGAIETLYTSNIQTDWGYERISDNSYKLTQDPDERVYTRDSSKDLVLW